MQCFRCKTGAYVHKTSIEVRPNVRQTIAHCENCGLRWKLGNPYRIKSTSRKYKRAAKEGDFPPPQWAESPPEEEEV